MMKRILSFLLCLIMVVGLAAPSVQASSTDDVITSDNIMDNVYIENGSDANIVIDGNTVSASQDSKLPNPADLVTEPTEPPYVFGEIPAEEPVAVVGCQCVDLSTAVEHSGVCEVKAPYMELCGNASAGELYAQWGNYTLVEQDFIQDYLYEAFPQKSSELEKLLNAPTGSASETYVDGTTVSVEGIPQDGSLTVGDADAVKDIVDTYVAEQEMLVSPLFSYDVSVQDGEGADWQPEVNVKMELELPGEKLHKNTKVFVVHVDDNGVATTIEATVTEDGKIAFETPGFSAFYGFTVDFEFNGVEFSIGGMSNITLSELFVNMNMPLSVEDVANVEFTDYELISVEKQTDGDWLLTSLQAFDTDEKLTLTMSDGAVYQINVTDATDVGNDGYAEVYVGGSTSINYDKGPSGTVSANGEITWNANTSGGSLNAHGWSRTQQVEISGPGTMIINIQNGDDYADETLYVDLLQLKITDGAQVTIRAGGDFLNSNKRVCIRSSAHVVDGCAGWGMIWVQNGSLSIEGRDVDGVNVDLVFGGRDDWHYSVRETIDTAYKYNNHPLILLGSGATSLNVKYAEFMHSASGAIGNQKDASPSTMTMTLDHCIFHKSVFNQTKRTGGAVQLKPSSSSGGFTATNCTFNGNTCVYRGGAVSIDTDITNVKFDTCTFTSISSQNHAGAIGIGKDSDVAVSVTKLEILNCGFNTCSAAGRGGALRMLSKGSPTVTIQNSTFYNCSAGTNGGAVTLQGSVGNVSITGTKTTSNGTTTYSTYFNDCTSVSRGGAIDGSCTNYGTITITDVSFARNTSGSHGGAVYLGTNGSNRHSAGAVSVSGCNFEDNQGQGVGGGLCLTEGTFASVALKNTTFNKCRTSGFGGGFGMKVSGESVRKTQDVIVTGDVKIQDCTFTYCHGGAMQPNAYTDADSTVPKIWDHDGNPATPEIDELNGTGGGGAIALGGTFTYVEITGNTNKDMPMQNCTSWNNGGAITFHSGMKVTGKTVDGKKVGIKLQYLDIDKCFARDAGNAIYFPNVEIDPFEMIDCTVQNCDSFDIALEANKAHFTPLITDNELLEDLNFGTPTVYKKDKNGNVEKNENGNPVVDTAATEALRETLLTRWKGYSNEDLFESVDNGGTIRTVGNSAVNAVFDNCEIKYNGSFGCGGGVYWNANYVIKDANDNVTLTPKVVISNTYFTGNRAGLNGGGLFCEAYVEILSCNFSENSAGSYGGAIYQGMYNNQDRQLGASGGTENNNLVLGTATGTGKQPTKIYNNSAKNGGGIAISISATNSYPHTLKSGIKEGTDAARLPENWNFNTNFTYQVKFNLGGAHVYNNEAQENGGGIYYSTTYYGDLTGKDSNKVAYSERQRQVDSFQKEVMLNNGLIYGNVAGKNVVTHAVKVTDASTLKAGDQLIIAAKDDDFALSTNHQSTYRTQAGITKDDSGYVVVTAETEVLTLEQGSKSGTFALKIPAGYLNTYTERDITTTQYIQDSSSWTITINGTGAATLVSQLPDRDYNRNRLFYDCDDDYYVNYSYLAEGQNYVEDYGVFRLISTEIENGRLAELVTDASTLKAGDQIVIATLKQFLSMSKTATSDGYRKHKVLSKQTAKVLTFSDSAAVEELTLEAGTLEGTYALKTHDNKYLATGTATTDDKNHLLTATAKSDVASWDIKIHPVTGLAYVVAQGTGAYKHLRFNAYADWFKCYGSGSNESYVSIYKVTQTVSGGKLAKLVTSTSDLRHGDKIIIVAMLEDEALGTTLVDSGVARMEAHVTKYDRTSFGEDVQVVTLQNGHKDLPGTFALQLPDGQYLRTSSKGLTLTTDLVSTSSWTISVDPSTGVATIGSNGPDSTYTGRELTYNPTERVFSSYANDTQKDVVLYRLEQLEVGEGGNGGGLYMNSNQSQSVNGGHSTLSISGGSIYSNIAYFGNGGGIYLQGTNALCTISGETTGIGTVCTKSGTTVSLSTDGRNTATNVLVDTNNYYGGNGGGIAIFGGARIEMSGGYIYNNLAETAGGGVAVHNSTMSFANGTVKQNEAVYGGGISIMNGGDVSTVTSAAPVWGMDFSNGFVSDNIASGLGGGICLSNNSTMKLNGGQVLRNYVATTATSGDYSYTDGQWGGGIAVCKGSYMSLLGGTIDSNYAYDGGGLAISGKSVVAMGYSTGSTAGGTVSNNYAAHDGGGIWLNGTGSGHNTADRNQITISGGTISTNTAVRNGGGVLLGVAGYFEMNDGKITGNSSVNGGGICCDTGAYNNSDVIINNGEISYNTAEQTGGGIYGYYYTHITMSGGDIINNKAVNGNGGGLYSYFGDPFNFSGGKVDGNYAGLDGGGLYINRIPCNFTNGFISNNTAGRDGGGVFVTNGDAANKLTVNGGAITGNTATGNGGGICAANKGRAEILATGTDHGEVSENQAKNGGGIYVTGGSQLMVNNGFVIKNHAVQPSDASGLYTAKGKLTTLYGSGGGICVTAGTSTDISTFTLTGDEMAIYGNTATFAADDVCSTGSYTQLTIPEVTVMDLAGYGFNPEGWVEDYAKNDTMYSTYGLNMHDKYALTNSAAENLQVLRYRNATSAQRRFMLIKPEYVSGSGLDDGTVYANKAGAYVCMTLGIPTAMDDTVVLDYGSEVLINAWQNDLFLRNEDDTSTNNVNENDFRVDGAGTTEGGYLGYSFTTGTNTGDIKKYEDTCYLPITENKAPQSIYAYSRYSIRSAYGDVWTGQNGTYSYTPKVKSLDMVDSFFYAVAHNGFWYYAKMNIVPATTIYYEDNFGEWGNNTPWINYHKTAQHEKLAAWTQVGDDTEGAYFRQDEDRPGGAYMDGIDHDNAYGYDSSYSTSTKFSDGTAHKVRVYRNADGSTVNARATFTFTGTGFDIISYCSAGTGVVSVSVWDKPMKDIVFEDDPDTDDYEITTPIATYATDTYYQNGGTTGLYQVPVIKADLTQVPVYDQNWNATGEYYGYGTYTVEIYVAPGWYPKDHSYNGCEFYLDAIRIYDPVGYNGSQSQLAQDAYLADGEGWPVYQELRNLVLSRYEADFEVEGGTDRINTEKEGMIFIDGSDTPSIADYKAWGPNNEVYVKGASSAGAGDGQGVGFVLNAANYAKDGLEIDRVHIGLRGLTDTGTVEIWKGDTLFRTVHISTTDMYYDITGLMNNVLTIKNVGTTPIAISNLKITHKKQPGSGTRGPIVTTDQETVKAALNVFNVEQLAEITVTPKRPALSFNGMVCYNVFFDAQDLGDLTAADLGLAVFNTYAPDGTVENANEVHLGAEEIDGLYMVATDGVHAKYLGDTKFFRAFAKKADGSYVYSKMVSYSAVDYAKNILAKSDDVKLKQLVVAMLNYGAEAQKFFGYKTYNLMNKDLTADDLALLNGFDANSLNKVGKVDASKVGAFASTGGFTKRSPAISFKGAFEINYFMTPAYAVDGDMTMYFWTEDTYNSVTELTADNADKAVVMTPENGSYTACSDEIIAKYLDKTVYVAAVYESNGVTYCSGVLPYSIAAYCQKPPASVQDLATAAAIYGCTAKQYFGA